jgi:hypothetical protein
MAVDDQVDRAVGVMQLEPTLCGREEVLSRLGAVGGSSWAPRMGPKPGIDSMVMA